MSFSPSFAASQNTAIPKRLTLTDSSDGAPTGAVSRRVSFRLWDGSFMLNGVSNYFNWPLADVTVDFDFLDRDLALYTFVEWLDVGGDTLYMADNYRAFDLNAQIGRYNILQKYVVNYQALRDGNHLAALVELDNAIEGATNAILIGGNLDLAQICLDIATDIINNKNVIF